MSVTTEPAARPETAPEPRRRSTGRTVMYVVIVLALLAMTAAGVARFRYNQESKDANAKAEQLIEKWQAANLRVPDKDVIVRMYGTEGGVLCKIDPARVTKGMFLIQLANGAAGPGQRPVIVPEKLVAGERAVLEVYCPERVAGFDRIVNSLKLSSS